jgi:hypothetical protein
MQTFDAQWFVSADVLDKDVGIKRADHGVAFLFLCLILP